MRFGLLGTGYWARTVHAAALAAHPDAEFVGVWGRNPEKAREVGELYAVPPYERIEELLAAVDAVALALPPDVQAPLAVQAAQAGCHLLLEKPVALAVAGADALVAEVTARRLASVVFFANRFQASARAELADIAQAGGWLGGSATFFAAHYESENPYAESPWRKEHGGLWDLGPHTLAQLIPVLGPVTGVIAMQGPRQTTHVTLHHAGGAVSTMQLTLNAPRGADQIETVLHGESGWRVMPGFDGAAVAAFGQAVSELIGSVPAGRHPLDVRFGRDVVAVLAAAETAARTGTLVQPAVAVPGTAD